MNQLPTLCERRRGGMRVCAHRYVGQPGAVTVIAAALLGGLTAPRPVHAVDGCLVLLCLAAPRWQDIPQCVPTIHQLHRDLARGKPFPVCKEAGPGNNLQHEWVRAPTNCPPQYTHVIELESGPSYSCSYLGLITVLVDGTPFTRTWWTEGDTVTEFSPAAKAQLGTWNSRFDHDFAAWLTQRPAHAPVGP